MFIPGNPGITTYYKTFFTTLRQIIPGLDIISANFVGFNPQDPIRDAQSIDLQAQIADRIDRLDGILLGLSQAERKANLPIYLAGHSVGAYIALQVLAARPESIDRVYLLTPTISDIAQSAQGQLMTHVLKVPGIVQSVATFTWVLSHCLPSSIVSGLVKWFTGLPDDAVHITTQEVLRKNVVYTALTLARSEMLTITSPDLVFWQRYASRCSAYWATKDRWVSDSHRTELLAVAKGMESYHCKDAPHAFCLRHGEVVAKKVGDWMKRDIAMHEKGTEKR